MYKLYEGENANTFYFTTSAGVLYEIELIEVDEHTFPAFQSANRFFLIDVLPLNQAWENLPAEDPGIGQTVAFAIQQILSQNSIAIAYSCETTDNRQKARYRKFNQWFIRFNDGTFLKYDAEITATQHQYFVSVVVQHGPYLYQLAQEFLTFMGDFNVENSPDFHLLTSAPPVLLRPLRTGRTIKKAIAGQSATDRRIPA